MSRLNQALYHYRKGIYAATGNLHDVEKAGGNLHVCHIGEDKDTANAISKIPVGKVWDRDTYEDEEAYEEIIVAKTRLLKDYPFWGILSMHLTVVEDTSGFIPTLAVDGRHLFYSADFVLKLNRGERLFAVGHEILHCLLAHAGKKNRGMSYAEFDPDEKDPKKRAENALRAKIWNFANDFIVNDELVQGKVGDFITTIQILHDTKFRGWSSEEVFDYLMEHPEEMPSDGQQFDTHLEIEIVDDDEAEGEEGGEGQPGGHPNRIKMKRSDFDKMQKDWQDGMVRAAAAQKEAEARGECAGSLPAGIQRMLDELMKPKVNWKALLRRYVMQTMRFEYNWMMPNKCFFNDGWTLPSFRSYDDMLEIVIAVDTSGSISQDQLTAFVSEMDGIMKSFPAYKIRAWCFDGAVVEDSIVTIEKNTDSGSFEDIKKFAERIGGGGGTDFMVNWHYMKEKKIKPKLFLFLTDGMPFSDWGIPARKTGFPTIYLIIGNQGTNAPKSIGRTIHYEEPQKVA